MESNEHVIALIGNPNAGKSTLFNQLTGLNQKIGNYPGVTVEKRVGQFQLEHVSVSLIDLPGTYSLSAQSPDEMVVLDVLRGELAELRSPEMILIIADASNLRRNLYLVSQLLELGLPVVLVLNMMDLARDNGIHIDVDALSEKLQVPVLPVVATTGEGIEALKQALINVMKVRTIPTLNLLPEIRQNALTLTEKLNTWGCSLSMYEVERALIDQEGYAEQRIDDQYGAEILDQIKQVRASLTQGPSLATQDARMRYGWINSLLGEIETIDLPDTDEIKKSTTERIDQIVSHPVIGSVLFLLLMAVVFQSVFAWAAPLMDFMDGATASIGHWLESFLPEGALRSLLVDGIIAGVGSVIIFLPQILILFAFIIFLEDSGYMARAAFMADRVMRSVGLSGRSFIPMLSSFACAVPGVMATRTISDKRDRIATMMAAPFMTCSARLPVYALLIAAFVPKQTWLGGIINLQGLVLLGLYLLGILGGVITALLLKRTLLRGPAPTFLMEMPPYRWPSLMSVLIKLWERGKIFLRRAGTIIFTVAVLIWALAYFPHPESVHQQFEQQRNTGQLENVGQEEMRIFDLDNQESAIYLEQSYLGRAGKLIAPVFQPLGWDWKVSAAVVASFPAREVVIAVLGTIYAVGGDVDEEDGSLINRIKSSIWPDGSNVFTTPMAVGLMIFYAFCLQCVATIATIKRETGTWHYPVISWVYMTSLGYFGALLIFQLWS
ncbi:MAG: ferrous iron transport protein B [Gammaproteobacteria bacterium]